MPKAAACSEADGTGLLKFMLGPFRRIPLRYRAFGLDGVGLAYTVLGGHWLPRAARLPARSPSDESN